MIERKILIGLITSTEYLQQLHSIWDIRLLESATARRVAGWCWEYFDHYNHAPKRDIEGIYYAKVREGNMPKEIAQDFEETLLPSLSKEYTNDSFNLAYLLDQTRKYFTERRLTLHVEEINALLAGDDLLEAEKLACDYKPQAGDVKNDLDVASPTAVDHIEAAFAQAHKPLVEYKDALGRFWNHDFVRGGFVALMGSEKRGKTFWLLDIALNAYANHCNVAFFQAGDMSENEQLMRLCIKLVGKSTREEYCKEHWQPVRDCINNQLNDCKKPERTCNHGVFEGMQASEVRKDLALETLIGAYTNYPDYRPCDACKEYDRRSRSLGVPWLRKIRRVEPLTVDEAKKAFKKAFPADNDWSLRFSTHANGTLSVRQIKAILSIWQKQDGFVPDVIVIDYADLLNYEGRLEFRHAQNEIWKSLRNLSQERHCLVVTATQADAKSYDVKSLARRNFSEDKRKYAHVTAMWGLNQDKDDVEKAVGIMRINELVKREGDFSVNNQVTVLQNLRRGRVHLTSY